MNRGFSLVELSIVLVILGLLTGGILAGQSLIRAAELRSISSDTNRYATAMQTFRDKYFVLPGDMPNAVKFWGAQAGGTADGADAACVALTTAATGLPTCNGDGDGIISLNSTVCYERHRYWQHLANAGLIEGQYAGVRGPAGNCHSTLSASPPNTPRSRINNAGFSVGGGPNTVVSANHSYFDGPAGIRLFFGGQDDANASSMWAPVIKSEEAWNIDSKMDDGSPALGRVKSYKNGSTWGSPACSTTAAADAQYALSVSGNICALTFQIN